MSTKIKNQVLDLLQWSTQEYEDSLYQTIYNWCEQHGKYPSITQQLLANSQINKWFLQEYHKLELQFLKIADVVPNNTTALAKHHKGCIEQIFEIYPMALMEDIKRNKDFSNIFIIKSAVVYYAN